MAVGGPRRMGGPKIGRFRGGSPVVCGCSWKDLSRFQTRGRSQLSKQRAELLQYVKGNKRALARSKALPEQYRWVGIEGNADAEDDSNGGDVDVLVLDGIEDEEEIAPWAVDDLSVNVLDRSADASDLSDDEEEQ